MEPFIKRLFRVYSLFCSKLPNILCDFHAAKIWAAHTAKMCCFSTFCRQGFIMIFPCSIRVKRKIELVFPPKVETGLAHGIVAILWSGMTSCQICGLSSNFVGDNTVSHVLFIRQS